MSSKEYWTVVISALPLARQFPYFRKSGDINGGFSPLDPVTVYQCERISRHLRVIRIPKKFGHLPEESRFSAVDALKPLPTIDD